MPVFEYKGVDINSKNVSGVIDAESEKAARSKLRKQKIFPTKVVAESVGRGVKGFKIFNGVKIEEVAAMTRQLAVLLGAGIPLIDSLAATQDQVEHQTIRKALADIKDKVSEGGRLADCMQAYPDVFDNIYIYMVRAGEASGSLDIVLKRLADFKESQASTKAKIKSALNYPIIMVVVALLIIGYIFTSVVPKMTSVFVRQKLALPWSTQFVMSITYVIQNYWYLVFVAFVFGFITLRSYKRSARGRERLDEWKLKMPVFGELNRKVAVARFSRTLSTLLNSGVQLLPALEIVRNVMDNIVLSKVVATTMVSVKEGESLAEPLRRSRQFPTLFVHMVTVGEKTGMLEQMLEKVADTYDGEVDTYVSGMTSLLTPIIIVLMGGVIGFIVFSVLTPIFQLMQAQ